MPELVTALADPEVARFTGIPHPYTEQHAREFLAGRAVQETSLAIVAADGGGLLGGIGLRSVRRRCGELEYWVRADARGRGLATRALRLVAAWAFAELGLVRLQLLTVPENTASQRAAQRAGFRREGVLRSYLDDGRADGVMYSLLAGDV